MRLAGAALIYAVLHWPFTALPLTLPVAERSYLALRPGAVVPVVGLLAGPLPGWWRRCYIGWAGCDMDRQQLLRRLEKAWAALTEAYADLSEAQMTEAGVTGDWSVKDILAHVSWWEAEALKHLPHILAGGRPPRYSTQYGGIDAFNAQMTELKRGLALIEVLRQLEVTHRRLVAYVESVPEEEFKRDTRFRRRLRLDTYSHYPLHARAIREWRERSAG